MSPDSAFFFSGRFIVRITTCAVAFDGAVLGGDVEDLGHGRQSRTRSTKATTLRRPAGHSGTCSSRPHDDQAHPRERGMGFWKYAQEDPGYLAIVDPDGTEHTAGDVLARANQIVHALRALGLQRGDTVAGGAAQRRAPDARLPRRAAGRLVLRADQLPAVARRRSRTSSRTPTRRRSSATSASPSVVSAAADEAGIPSANRLAHGTDPGLPLVRRGGRRAAHDAARGPLDRRGDALHVGHHRQAQGREAPARRPRSRRRAPSCSRSCSACSASRRATATCTSARRRTTTPRSRRSRATRCT